MKKLITLSTIILLSSCGMPSSRLGFGIFGETTEPLLITENSGSKTGRSCSKNLLGLIVEGDSSVKAAKKDGKISKVSSVDREVKRMFIMSETCTIVTGH